MVAKKEQFKQSRLTSANATMSNGNLLLGRSKLGDLSFFELLVLYTLMCRAERYLNCTSRHAPWPRLRSSSLEATAGQWETGRDDSAILGPTMIVLDQQVPVLFSRSRTVLTKGRSGSPKRCKLRVHQVATLRSSAALLRAQVPNQEAKASKHATEDFESFPDA